MWGDRCRSRGLLILAAYLLAAAPVHADYIVPIAAHSPQVVVSLTTEKHPDDFITIITNSSTISGPLTMPLAAAPHYAVATWDTGAPVHILSREAFEDFDLAGAGKTGQFPTLVNGVGAIASDPLGIYTGGFGSVITTSPTVVDTSSLRGQTNVSVLYAPAGESLPMIVGTPLSSQYTSVFDYANPQILTIDGQEFRSPDVTIAEFDVLPDPDRRLQLNVAAGIFGDPPAFFPSFTNLEDFSVDPAIPTIGPSYYLAANIDDDGNNRNQLDMIYDTGSQGTFVSEQVAATLGFDVINDTPDFTVQLQTVSGTTNPVPGFFADQLELPGTDGGIVLSNVPLIVFNLPDPRGIGGILDGLIGQNVFGDRIVTFDPEPATMLGDPGPFVGVSDPALDNHDWNSSAASAAFNSPASWTNPLAPELDWIAHVENNATFDQRAVVGADASVSALNIIGDVDKMTVSVDASATLTVFGTIIVIDNGELHVGGGAVDPLGIELRGGSLTGHGDVDGEVLSQGLIAPGDSAGVLHFLGNVDQLAQGTLAIELGGTDNSDPENPEFDELIVTGISSLDGTLEVALIDGFLPSTPDPTVGDYGVGDSFTVVTVLGGLVDRGITLVGGDYDNLAETGRELLMEVTAGAVRLDAFQYAAGDTDFNLRIDSADIQNILAANSFNNPLGGPYTWFQGDFDNDGDVDTGDIQMILTSNLFGAGSYAALPSLFAASAQATVPEPSSLVLAAIALVSLIAYGWRRRRA